MESAGTAREAVACSCRRCRARTSGEGLEKGQSRKGRCGGAGEGGSGGGRSRHRHTARANSSGESESSHRPLPVPARQGLEEGPREACLAGGIGQARRSVRPGGKTEKRGDEAKSRSAGTVRGRGRDRGKDGSCCSGESARRTADQEGVETAGIAHGTPAAGTARAAT